MYAVVELWVKHSCISIEKSTAWMNYTFLSRVCVSNANPGGISGWERLWADGGHEHSEEGQEDNWLPGVWGSLLPYCLHRHYWEYQVAYCWKCIIAFHISVFNECHSIPVNNYLKMKVMSSFCILFYLPTRDIFPEGLPPSYVFVATLRLKRSSSKLTFDLWRVLSKDKEIQAAVTLGEKDKSVTFTTTSITNTNQKVIFKSNLEVGVKTEWLMFIWLLCLWLRFDFKVLENTILCVKMSYISMAVLKKHYFQSKTQPQNVRLNVASH